MDEVHDRFHDTARLAEAAPAEYKRKHAQPTAQSRTKSQDDSTK
jgi:hypothetical protein